ncbi:hypothetical protein HYH02_013380 [Chlamydomonas schloesseri]|uniref:Uncharacterized protein n=1 Tax=Chlamydomonas schloesseri TaxID=2026947 RepID=A0A835W021_9CHLO|nr:hypothetical protein HYH02_013380 [Chlamydomonas schloesseri]|eukprot:KAG2431246.1 hypothetical protein HYH02_013380 [Chlamydomonas schloesseri]
MHHHVGAGEGDGAGGLPFELSPAPAYARGGLAALGATPPSIGTAAAEGAFSFLGRAGDKEYRSPAPLFGGRGNAAAAFAAGAGRHDAEDGAAGGFPFGYFGAGAAAAGAGPGPGAEPAFGFGSEAELDAGFFSQPVSFGDQQQPPSQSQSQQPLSQQREDLPLSQRQRSRRQQQRPRHAASAALAAHPAPPPAPAAAQPQRPHQPAGAAPHPPRPLPHLRPHGHKTQTGPVQQPGARQPSAVAAASPSPSPAPAPAAAPHALEPSPYHNHPHPHQDHDQSPHFFQEQLDEGLITAHQHEQDHYQQQQHQQQQRPGPEDPQQQYEQQQQQQQQPRSLGQRLLQWLLRSGALDEAAGPEGQDEQGRLQLPPDRAVSLTVDVMGLINADPEVGCWLLADMKAAQWALLDELHVEGLCASPCPRIHLRPAHLPMPCQQVPGLLACLCSTCGGLGGPGGGGTTAAAAAGRPASCYGVVMGVSSLGRRPHSRSLVCLHCGGSREVLEDRGLQPLLQGAGAEEEEAVAQQARLRGPARRGPGGGGGGGPGGGAGGWARPAVCDCGAGSTIHDMQEDLSGRVMVECQEIWLGGLGSAAPGAGHFARPGCMRVVLGDGLAGAARVGDVVEVVGLVQLLGPPGARAGAAATGWPGSAAASGSGGGGAAAASLLRSAASAAATAELEALAMSHVSPLRAWAPLGGAGAGDGSGGGLIAASGRPLQLLCDVLCRLLGREVERLTCLALLASAVSVGGGAGSSSSSSSSRGGNGVAGAGGAAGTGAAAAAAAAAAAPNAQAAGGGALNLAQQQQAQAQQQLCVLLGCERHDPLGPRLLRSAAALLSPLGAWLGGAAAAASAGTATSHLTDDVILPRLQQSSRPDGSADGAAAASLSCSALLAAANRGVAVVDADVLSSKQKAQLCDTLGRRQLVPAPGRPELSVPITATVWAAAVRHATAADCDPEASGGAPSGGRRGGGGGRGPVPGSLRGGWSGLDESCFDVVLGHVAVDDVAAEMALDEGSLDPGDRRPLDPGEAAALTAALRAHVAAAALLVPGPALSDAGLDLLMRYYVAVRQSGVKVSQAEVLRALVKVATACARLHLRSQVAEAPDCVLAVLLTEATLACRFGEGYMGLGLPPLQALLAAGSGWGAGGGGGGGGGYGEDEDVVMEAEGEDGFGEEGDGDEEEEVYMMVGGGAGVAGGAAGAVGRAAAGGGAAAAGAGDGAGGRGPGRGAAPAAAHAAPLPEGLRGLDRQTDRQRASRNDRAECGSRGG